MYKFKNSTKVNFLNASSVLLKYSLWIVFFVMQGRSIDLAVSKRDLLSKLIFTLGLLIILKMIVILLDALMIFFLEFFKNDEIYSQWKIKFPGKVYRDTALKDHEINQLFFDYLPSLFELQTMVSNNIFTLVTIFLFAILVFLYENFSIGVLFLPLVFFSNFLSRKIYLDKLNILNNIEINQKSQILQWIKQYFLSYKEISKIWNNKNLILWSQEAYKPYFENKKSKVLLTLNRDILTHFFVEFPFMLNTCMIIIAVYYSYLSLEEMFVWIGFGQFMIQVSNNYIDNQVYKQRIDILQNKICLIFSYFYEKKSAIEVSDLINIKNEYEILMQDGTKNIIGLSPKIYLIKGNNGAGKSTLMEQLMGYERINFFKNSMIFKDLVNQINPMDIRLIERDSIVFENLLNFNSQIFGPYYKDELTWKDICYKNSQYLFNDELTKKWINIFENLEYEYNNRIEKKFSSGEKVVFSFIRFLASWNSNVKVLIVDECDAFLDITNKRLFAETLNVLSKHMAVYISSHDKEFLSLLSINHMQHSCSYS